MCSFTYTFIYCDIQPYTLGKLELNILHICMLFGDHIVYTEHILFPPSQASDWSHPYELILQLIHESFEY